MNGDNFADQRFYNIVVLGPNPEWRIGQFWQGVGPVEPGRREDQESDRGIIQYRTIRTQRPYGTAAVAAGEPGEGYKLDVFAVESFHGGERYLALAVPYIDLGRRMMIEARDGGLLIGANFLTVELPELVGAVREKRESVNGFRIRKVQLRFDSDPDLGGLAISGENALYTSLYRKIMDVTKGSEPTIYRCSVTYYGAEAGSVLTMHCDASGNFRAWVRKDCVNVALIHGYLRVLLGSGVCKLAASIPFFRQTQDPEAEEGA